MKNFKMVATTMYGFEAILEKELVQLGAMQIKKGIRSVSFVGDTGFMYKANLSLRTALCVLKPVYTFKFDNEDDFYKKLYNYEWEKHMSVNQTFMVQATIFQSVFKHSQFVALRTKDALVDRFRNKTGKRPSVSTDSPKLVFNIHVNRNHCTLSIDS